MKAARDVTLSLPEPLLRRLRVYAVSRNESMSSVMAEVDFEARPFLTLAL